MEVLKTELERERQAKKRWKRKYFKMKSLFTAVEMEREVIDLLAMAAPPPAPPAPEPRETSFYKTIRINENMFVTYL